MTRDGVDHFGFVHGAFLSIGMRRASGLGVFCKRKQPAHGDRLREAVFIALAFSRVKTATTYVASKKESGPSRGPPACRANCSMLDDGALVVGRGRRRHARLCLLGLVGDRRGL